MTEYITLALAGAAAVLALVCVLTRPRQGATLRDLQNLTANSLMLLYSQNWM